ncbi:MAG: biotin/lipoyl-containing protein [Bdellovibrionota bacterium]
MIQKSVEFDRALHGREGYARFRFPSGDGNLTWTEFRWERTPEGIAIEIAEAQPGGALERHHFDLEATLNEEGARQYDAYDFALGREYDGICFARVGEMGVSMGGRTGLRSGPKRLKAQMPGRIVRIHLKPGDPVEKDQPVLVMEAMKMENEIRATASGQILRISVQVGQTVETGAELAAIEAK